MVLVQFVAAVALTQLWLWSAPLGAAQLPPEVMVDRELIRAQRLVADEDHAATRDALHRIDSLRQEHDLTLPHAFHFQYARVALSVGLLRAAIDSATEYLKTGTRTDEFYGQALRLLDEAERIQTAQDRHFAQLEQLVAAGRHQAAIDPVNELVALRRERHIVLPDEFHFLYARAALSAGSVRSAMDSVNEYLSVAGTAGEFHREALALLDETERLSRPIEPEMLVVPAGTYRMGCLAARFCDDDQLPAHEVTVESFALSKYEVTFKEYDRFAAATGRELPDDEGYGRGRRPVINVSWYDAVAYTEWLSFQAGTHYRLPSEAEWEYAARAGSTTTYSWGDESGAPWNEIETRAQWGGAG